MESRWRSSARASTAAESRPLGLPPGDVLAVSRTGKMAISWVAIRWLGRDAHWNPGRGASRGKRSTRDPGRRGRRLQRRRVEAGRRSSREGKVQAGVSGRDASLRIAELHRLPPDLALGRSHRLLRARGPWPVGSGRVVELSGKKRVLSRDWEPGRPRLVSGNERALVRAPGRRSTRSVSLGKAEEPRWRSTQAFSPAGHLPGRKVPDHDRLRPDR